MRPPAPPIDLTSETTHVGGSFEHIGNKKIQTCYSVTPDFFHGISVKLGPACGGGLFSPKTSGWGRILLLLMGVQKNNRFP